MVGVGVDVDVGVVDVSVDVGEDDGDGGGFIGGVGVSGEWFWTETFIESRLTVYKDATEVRSPAA